MIVLSRMRDETLIIANTIQVSVVDIRGGKVRLGSNAPSHIDIYRKEVYDQIRREVISTKRIPPQRRANAGGLLVLSRLRDESIVYVDRSNYLNPIAEVVVADIRGDKVRLGTNAERAVEVHRLEIWEAIHRSKYQTAVHAHA